MSEILRRVPGIQLAAAIQALETAISEGANLRSMGGPIGGHHKGYLDWIDQQETRLIPYFVRFDIERFLMTPRYWEIRRTYEPPKPRIANIDKTYPMPTFWDNVANSLIVAEATARIADLEEVAKRLKALRDRYGSLTTPVLVPDTNTFLHYRFFDEAPWQELGPDASIHLAIPLVVIEQLDQLKFAPHISDRARKVIRALDRIIGSTQEPIAELKGRGTIEVVPEERGHIRLPVIDNEIVQVCSDLNDLIPTTASVVTGDLGMKVRARTLDVSVISIPDTEAWHRSNDPVSE